MWFVVIDVVYAFHDEPHSTPMHTRSFGLAKTANTSEEGVEIGALMDRLKGHTAPSFVRGGVVRGVPLQR